MLGCWVLFEAGVLWLLFMYVRCYFATGWLWYIGVDSVAFGFGCGFVGLLWCYGVGWLGCFGYLGFCLLCCMLLVLLWLVVFVAYVFADWLLLVVDTYRLLSVTVNSVVIVTDLYDFVCVFGFEFDFVVCRLLLGYDLV